MKKNKFTEIFVTVFVLILAVLIIQPSIINCAQNASWSKCEKHAQQMMEMLTEGLIHEEQSKDDTYWHDLVENQKYDELLFVLNERTSQGKKYSVSDYYIREGERQITICCRRHRGMEKKIKFTVAQNIKMREDLGEPDARQILCILVDAPNEYRKGESLDPQDPSKMVFEGDETNRLFQNLNVTALYTNGTYEELSANNYTIRTEKLDMNKTGEQDLVITADVNYMWGNSVSTIFTLNITD